MLDACDNIELDQITSRIFETMNQALICFYIYYLTVLHYGQPDKIGAAPLPICLSIAIAGFTGTIVQVWIILSYRQNVTS